MVHREDFYLVTKLREALGISGLVGIGGDGTAR
jgi:6-phosphofructokinase